MPKVITRGELDIIVCHEKHGETYWDAQTPGAWAASSLAILTERWSDGYWYHDPDDDGLGDSEWAQERREEYRKALEMTQEEIAKLPESARKEVLGLRAAAKRDSAEDCRHRDWWNRAKAVVENQDAGFTTVGRNRYERQEPTAWLLLEERDGYEYERISLERLQTGDDAT